MNLRKECIGNTMTMKAPNGYAVTVIIEDDKRLFKHYKFLGLDVFEKNKGESTKSTNK